MTYNKNWVETNNKQYVEKELKKYENCSHRLKMSICMGAFEIFPNMPPWEAYFVLARQIGYEIPKKWEHMYK